MYRTEGNIKCLPVTGKNLMTRPKKDLTIWQQANTTEKDVENKKLVIPWPTMAANQRDEYNTKVVDIKEEKTGKHTLSQLAKAMWEITKPDHLGEVDQDKAMYNPGPDSHHSQGSASRGQYTAALRQGITIRADQGRKM